MAIIIDKVVGQGSANCGPRSQNLRPARYFLTKIILFKNKKKIVIKT